jgi:hypothetical protein
VPVAEEIFASRCTLEKGEADGSDDALQLIAIVADRLGSRLP